MQDSNTIQGGQEYLLMKDPKTDSGKKSPRGRVKVVGDICIDELTANSDFEDDRMKVVFENGIAYTMNIDDIRSNTSLDAVF